MKDETRATYPDCYANTTLLVPSPPLYNILLFAYDTVYFILIATARYTEIHFFFWSDIKYLAYDILFRKAFYD